MKFTSLIVQIKQRYRELSRQIKREFTSLIVQIKPALLQSHFSANRKFTSLIVQIKLLSISRRGKIIKDVYIPHSSDKTLLQDSFSNTYQ